MNTVSDYLLPCTPLELVGAANAASLNLLPAKSREKYELAYQRLMDFCRKNNSPIQFPLFEWKHIPCLVRWKAYGNGIPPWSKGCSRNFMKKFVFSSFGRPMSTIKEKKNELREYVSQRLAALSKDEKDKQSEVVVKKVLQLPEFGESLRVSIFLSTDDEINTKRIVEKLFQYKKQCFIPRYSKNGMEMVKLHSMVDWENLPLTPWKIKQPKLKEERENALNTGGLDLMIVPGVAFTKDGKRLGHGGGYYDRYIRNLKDNQKTPIATVGVAFREQILDDIPTHDHDQIIDKILFWE